MNYLQFQNLSQATRKETQNGDQSPRTHFALLALLLEAGGATLCWRKVDGTSPMALSRCSVLMTTDLLKKWCRCTTKVLV